MLRLLRFRFHSTGYRTVVCHLQYLLNFNRLHSISIEGKGWRQGVPKNCRLYLMTNSALLIRVKMRREGVTSSQPMSAAVQCAHHLTWSPNKLWRSTSIINLWLGWPTWQEPWCSVPTDKACRSPRVLHACKKKDFSSFPNKLKRKIHEASFFWFPTLKFV
jgi:hypothetical protein